MNDEALGSRDTLLAELTVAIREEMRLAAVWNDAAAKFVGLYPTDTAILFFLHEKGSATASEVGKIAGLTTGATTAALIRLERSGFISREPDERDKRRVIVRAKQLPGEFGAIRRLTEAELRASLRSQSEAAIRDLIAHRRQINTMLMRIIAELGTMALRSSR